MKNCPFCGSINLSLCMSVGHLEWYKCDDCKAEGPVGIDTVEAIGLWNMRINPWLPITDDIKDGIQVVDIWFKNGRISKCKWNKETGCWRSYSGRYYIGGTHYIPDPPPPPEV